MMDLVRKLKKIYNWTRVVLAAGQVSEVVVHAIIGEVKKIIPVELSTTVVVPALELNTSRERDLRRLFTNDV